MVAVAGQMYGPPVDLPFYSIGDRIQSYPGGIRYNVASCYAGGCERCVGVSMWLCRSTELTATVEKKGVMLLAIPFLREPGQSC